MTFNKLFLLRWYCFLRVIVLDKLEELAHYIEWKLCVSKTHFNNSQNPNQYRKFKQLKREFSSQETISK